MLKTNISGIELYEILKSIIIGECKSSSTEYDVYTLIPAKSKERYIRLMLIDRGIFQYIDSLALKGMINDIEQKAIPEPKYKIGDIVINSIAKDFSSPWEYEVMRVINRKKVKNGEYWGYELRRVQKSFPNRNEGELMSIEDLEAYRETCGVEYEDIEAEKRIYTIK